MITQICLVCEQQWLYNLPGEDEVECLICSECLFNAYTCERCEENNALVFEEGVCTCKFCGWEEWTM